MAPRHLLAIALSLCACTVGTAQSAADDGGPSDANASSDAGSLDAGGDAGQTDAGQRDAGAFDAGLEPDDGGLPSWRRGLAVGAWVEVPGSALSSCVPSVNFTIENNGADQRLDAWNGLALDPRTSILYSVANGGHNDWPGNEVFSAQLLKDAPAWVELRASTPQIEVVRDQAYYSDGTPTSRHSFYGVEFSTAAERVLLFGGYMYGTGVLTPAMSGWAPGTKQYDAQSAWPDLPSSVSGLPGAPFVTDPSTGDVYAFGNYAVQRWNRASNAWSSRLESTFLYGFSAAAAYDSTRNRILLVGGDRAQGTSVGAIYDLAQNTLTAATFTGLGDAVLDQRQAALIYVPAVDAYFFHAGLAGGAITRIDAATLAISPLPTQGGASAPAATNGVWKRWLYVPRLAGAVYAPATSSRLWFVRLH